MIKFESPSASQEKTKNFIRKAILRMKLYPDDPVLKESTLDAIVYSVKKNGLTLLDMENAILEGEAEARWLKSN